MNFFEGQDRAKGRTKILIGFYIAGVLGVCVIMSLAALLVLSLGFESENGSLTASEAALFAGIVSAVTFAIICFGTIYKVLELRGGGSVIATRLGGRLIPRGEGSPNDRMLANVVDEMAIASGVPSPPIYVMEREQSINAFAAGYNPEDAVIGVTRGAIEQLSRDELQGVIAHEFSHILNGDMRLNIRLIGVLHGLMMITYLGYMLIRIGFANGAYNRVRMSKSKDGGLPHLVVVGAVMLVVGVVGAAFGSVIKSAVSRQREYLADASAVQFTRNPEGIGSALKRILAMSRVSKAGPYLRSEHAPEAEHMLFSDGVRIGLTSFMATHPPLAKRIRAIEPSWDGQLGQHQAQAETVVAERVRKAEQRHAANADRRKKALEMLTGGAIASGASGTIANGVVVSTRGLLSEAGTLTRRAIEGAAAVLDAIPERLRKGAGDVFEARWVVVGLVFAHEQTDGLNSMRDSLEREPDGSLERLASLMNEASGIELPLRLALLDLCLGTLRSLSESQTQDFLQLVDQAIRSDGKVDVFEWAIRAHVRGVLMDHGNSRVAYYGVQKLGPQISRVLSAMAHMSDEQDAPSQAAFEAGARGFTGADIAYIPRDQSDLGELGNAVEVLRKLSPKMKRAVLEGCARVLSADDQVSVGEAEVFRALAVGIGVPVPMVSADRMCQRELPAS